MKKQKKQNKKEELMKRVMNPEKKTLDGMDEFAAYIEAKLQEEKAKEGKVTPVEIINIG